MKGIAWLGVGCLCVRVCAFASVNNSMFYLRVHAYACVCSERAVCVCIRSLFCVCKREWEEKVGIPVHGIEEYDNVATHDH